MCREYFLALLTLADISKKFPEIQSIPHGCPRQTYVGLLQGVPPMDQLLALGDFEEDGLLGGGVASQGVVAESNPALVDMECEWEDETAAETPKSASRRMTGVRAGSPGSRDRLRGLRAHHHHHHHRQAPHALPPRAPPPYPRGTALAMSAGQSLSSRTRTNNGA